MSHKDKYGPPITEEKITKTPTMKQVLQTPSSSSQSPNQNRFTPLTPLALPSFYPTTSIQPKTIRPAIQSQLISPLQFALNTPSQLNTTTQKPEKLPYYTPPSNLNCPFIEKDYKKILFLVEPEYSLSKSLL